MSIGLQILYLLVLALPIGCVAWTVTHEEVFREPRDWCKQNSENCRSLIERKFFYLFTCEYCFSHYVTLFFLLITRFWLLYHDWRGYVIAFFSLVWVANFYMNLYAHIRLDVTHERLEIKAKERMVNTAETESPTYVARP
jgi:hypothetical protein